MKSLIMLNGFRGGALAALVLALVLVSGLAPAAALGTPAPLPAPTGEGAPVSGEFAAAIVVDAETGDILFARDPHARHEPASMVKMMTELIVLEHVAAGRISMEESVEVSAAASRIGGSQVYLKHGERFTVEELLMALAIHSANDAAVALAEHVTGSVEGFVDLMNIRARELGLRETVFHSVHGLPPGRGQMPDLSSAHDMAQLGRVLIQFPEALRWGGMAEAPFRDGTFTLHNPNSLVGKFRGLDGIKTGYTARAGFCLTASAVRQNKRLIAVAMGCPSSKVRSAEVSRLLTLGFNQFVEVPLVNREKQPVEGQQRVKGGKTRFVSLAYARPLTVSVRRDLADAIRLEAQLPEVVAAPVEAGQEIGRALATLDGRTLGEVSIVAADAVPRGNLFQQIFQ